MPNDPSRPQRPGWRNAGTPSASAPPKHAWQRGSGQRKGPARAGMSRRAKFGLVGLCFLVLISGIIWLLYYIRPQIPPKVEFISASNLSNLAAPLSAYGQTTGEALQSIDLGDKERTRADSTTITAGREDSFDEWLKRCKSTGKQKGAKKVV